jgi:YfiH family protein
VRANEEKERHLKSDFQFNTLKNTILLPNIFSGYPDVRSGMSTKLGSKDQTGFEMNLSYHVGDDPVVVKMNREVFFSQFMITDRELAFPLQTHSSKVRTIDTPGEYEKCDALITNTIGVALGIIVADCVPILLFDPIEKGIGAVHAGWRGTSNSIVKRTINTMQEEFNTDTKNVLAFIGPSAGACCYEVSEEVAVKFDKNVVSYNRAKIFIDLKKENAFQLQQQGLIISNIEVSNHCTICEKQLFHSYRRDGKSAGRMMTFIYLKP